MKKFADLDRMIQFLRTVDRLEILPRTGYFFAGVRQPESIAAHSYGVILIAMLLADAMEEPVDTERVLRMAVLHDTTESVLTDIPYSIFKYIGSETKSEAEAKVATELLKPINEFYAEIWQEFEARQTLEAKIVNAADKLQLMIKILNYERERVGAFDEFWQNMAQFDFHGIALAQRVFARLVALHEQECGAGQQAG